ncbi:MAG: lanthionine synthetase LanC family protein [Acetobacteraceae bacterium]
MSAADTRFLDAAARIGRRLCRDAIWADGRCNWLGWAMEPHKGQWVTPYRAMGSLLYDGTAGIGLFLARLTQLTRDRIIRITAEGALAQALTAVEALGGAGDYGFYSGLGGIAWACTEAGVLLEHEELAARGQAALLLAARAPPHPHRLDIINGSAGLILALLDAVAQRRHEELMDAATRHGEHLLATAAHGAHGWSWDTLGMAGEKHLLGFAHGASGIACALAALGVTTGRGDFLDGAEAALRHERRHFRAAEGNWPDLRSFVQSGPTGEPPCMLAWCHGAPGIGFARVLLHRLLPADPAILAEAETAIRTTAAHLAPGAAGVGNFSLCHGDGGNADLLVLAADALARPELRRVAEAAARQALDRFEDAAVPWPCGIPNAGESPNLMLGVAGIGFFLLRLHDSRSVPTVLLPAARPLV